MQVTLQKDKKIYYKKIHRIVAETFIKNQNNLPQVNHIDGNKHNNNINNLEWCNASYNQNHSYYILHHGNNIKTVYQYDLNNKFIKKWASAHVVQKVLKIPYQNISACCRNEIKTAGGFIWKY